MGVVCGLHGLHGDRRKRERHWMVVSSNQIRIPSHFFYNSLGLILDKSVWGSVFTRSTLTLFFLPTHYLPFRVSHYSSHIFLNFNNFS